MVSKSNILFEISDISSSSSLLVTADSIYESLSDSGGLRITRNNLGNNYLHIGQYQKARSYFKSALEIDSLLMDTLSFLQTKVSVGRSNFYLNKFDLGRKLVNSVKLTAQKKGDLNLYLQAIQQLGISYMLQGNHQEALGHMQEVASLSKAYQYDRYSLDTYLNLATIFLETGNLDSADFYVNVLKKSTEIIAMDFQRRNLRAIETRILIGSGEKSKADKSLTRTLEFTDSIFQKMLDQNTSLLLVRHETYKKEQRITFLEKEQKLKDEQLKQKNQLMYGGATGSSIILILSSLIVYNQRQKQKAQRALSMTQKAEAAKSKKLEVFAAQIQAQEEEKERIARELHDGIAPSLAALKWTINDHLPNQKEALKVYKQLSSITEELQALSRGLSSPSAKENTLTENLITYLSAQERSGLYIDFKLPDNGLPSIRKPVEIAIYRAIQELTQSCIKHAEATELLVAFDVENSVLRIKMEDNGNGFDPKTAHLGIGLQNIKNRIQDLDGTFSIYPNLGIGTAAHIELDLRA